MIVYQTKLITVKLYWSLQIQTINNFNLIQQDMDNKSVPYLSNIHHTPILFTAPHSKKLKRGKPQQNIQDHAREGFTAFLAADLAKAGKDSFMIWKPTEEVSPTDLDPNYLIKQHFAVSPFHQSLHYWALKSHNTPLLHIDFHGKKNRNQNCHIDVGFMSMEVHWKKDPLIHEIKQFFQKQGDIFEDYHFGKFKCEFNTSPKLDGHWGGSVHTMNQQAILLGIPSLQMELPFDVRKKLFEDDAFRKRFRLFIQKLYESVIVPDYKRRENKQRIQKEIANHFHPNVNKENIDEVITDIINFQKGNH